MWRSSLVWDVSRGWEIGIGEGRGNRPTEHPMVENVPWQARRRREMDMAMEERHRDLSYVAEGS